MLQTKHSKACSMHVFGRMIGGRRVKEGVIGGRRVEEGGGGRRREEERVG